MPLWFCDLECNSRLWIVTHIWYMSLSFETIMNASMTRNELTICSIKFSKCRAASQWFHYLECNYRLWIVTQIWYMSLCFETIMMPRWPEGIEGYRSLDFETIKMPRWPERNWRVLFVPLNFVNMWFYRKLNFVNVGMPWWFYDLECNSRLWIVTHIWYMNLSFETIMNASMTQNELTDINCSIKFCKCVILKKTTFCECWDASVILWSWVQF